MGVFDLFKKKAEPARDAARPATMPRQETSDDAATETAPSLFGRFRSALKKTTDFLNTDIRDLFKREGRLVDDQFLNELYAILVKTDMGTGPAARIRDRIGSDFRARVVHMSDVLASVQDEVRAILKQPQRPIQFAASGPTVILVVGVNGSGKTTSIAKLMRMFRDQGKRVVVGAGDTFRAAAVRQLAIWAEREGAAIVEGENQGDPAAVAHKAVALAIQTGAEVCIIDTAGRLQTQTNLMQQLEKIYRVITKQIPDAPHEVLLVLDATAGQNALSQAQGFSTAAKCTGIILAKLDGTAKGGVIIPIRERFAIPVKFVGVGEKSSDLAVFDADQFAAALFADAA
ncbi:MAG: signal recognition particle-docking protein FtsY [Planctomycetaceae bacterium]|nr:signal recognition particle-docking protein FtsY [Planctomycetaceae bacterium]